MRFFIYTVRIQISTGYAEVMGSLCTDGSFLNCEKFQKTIKASYEAQFPENTVTGGAVLYFMQEVSEQDFKDWNKTTYVSPQP
jgi:hypothetical protein